jgi:hypothetical protein
VNRKTVLIVPLLVAALLACSGRQAPIYDVAGSTGSPDERPYSMADVRNAILRGGAKHGWAMQEDRPGHILGTLNVRSHQAQVDIDYDQQSYKIVYRNSSNLNYDGSNIHPNYNGWIRRLNTAISRELNALYNTPYPAIPPSASNARYSMAYPQPR